MHKYAFVFVLTACAGIGRRVHTRGEIAQSHHLLQAAAVLPISDRCSQFFALHGLGGARSALEQLEEFARCLLALKPAAAAAFNPSVSGQHNAVVRAPPTVSRFGALELGEAIPETVQEFLELCTISDYEVRKSSAFDRTEAEILEVQSRCGQMTRHINRAVQQEDYDTASTIMSQLCELRQLDPAWTLQRDIDEAVSSEEFERAAKLQAELRDLREARPRLMWRNEILVLSQNGRQLHAVGWNADTGEQTRRELMTAPYGCSLQQATWEPGGEWLAVAQISSGGDHRVLVLSADDGTVLGSVATPPVFFIHWGKCQSSRQALTFLHASDTGSVAGAAQIMLCACELRILRRDSSPLYSLSERRCVRTGGPLYYSIGNKDELLTNNYFFKEVSFSQSVATGNESASAGNTEARFATGTTTQLQNSASPCRAPLLTANASHAIYCEMSKPLPLALGAALPARLAGFAKYLRGNAVVAVELKTGRKKRLLKVPPNRETILQLSPDGTRLAVMRAPGKLVEVAPKTNQPRAAWPVVVLEAASSEALVGGRTIERQLVSPKMFTIASWFSPDSRKLLCLDVRLDISGEGSSADGKPLPRVSWTVWTFGEGAPTQVTYDPWVLSKTMLQDYVPFFDQYSVAGVSPWSPDSSAFCYTDEFGKTRVQWLDDTPRRLTDFLKPTAEVVAADLEGAVVSWWSPC